ncbi:MAG: hypothetical protein ABR554_04890 [Pyrinomonadaceae bacterium]
MADDLQGSQLGALAWLKWRLFRNAMRSRRAALNSAASVAGTLAALSLSLVFSLGIGFAAYALLDDAAPAHAVAPGTEAVESLLLLFGLLGMIFVMWAIVPVGMGGGSRFDPAPLLLYPVSLRKLFLIDLASELASLSSIFAVPALLATGIAAGLASGNYARALAASALAAAFGLSLSKLFSTTVAALMRARRGRGETLLALVGVVFAFSGVLIQQGVRLAAGAKSFPAALRWTPPGALVTALTAGSHAGGGLTYALSLATLALYALAATWLTYRVAVRALNASGGGRSRAALAAQARTPVKAGWRLPLASRALSTVFEKELRYALRNAQLRAMILMPVVMTVALRLGISPHHGGFGGSVPSVAPYLEGARAALGVMYAFMVTSALTANCFGYDGAGMRAFVLAPVPRRAILLGKNLAMLCVVAASALLVTAANQLIYGDLGARALLFAALAFLFDAGLLFASGNYFSVRFPQRMRFGKRTKSSGAAGLLMIPVFVAIVAVPALSILTGWLAGSVVAEYVILAVFATISVSAYVLLLDAQARELERRELDILGVVAARDED